MPRSHNAGRPQIRGAPEMSSENAVKMHIPCPPRAKAGQPRNQTFTVQIRSPSPSPTTNTLLRQQQAENPALAEYFVSNAEEISPLSPMAVIPTMRSKSAHPHAVGELDFRWLMRYNPKNTRRSRTISSIKK